MDVILDRCLHYKGERTVYKVGRQSWSCNRVAVCESQGHSATWTQRHVSWVDANLYPSSDGRPRGSTGVLARLRPGDRLPLLISHLCSLGNCELDFYFRSENVALVILLHKTIYIFKKASCE